MNIPSFAPAGRALRLNHDLRALFSAQAVSSVGDNILTIALTISVFTITGSALNVALVYVFTVIPGVLGLFAGPVLERFALKRMMIATDLIRMVLTALVPFLLTSSLTALYVVVFLVNLLSIMFQSARLSVLPEAAGESDLNQVNSLDLTMLLVGGVVGFAFGGALSALDYRVAFWIDSATFLASALILWRLRVGRHPLADRTSWRSFWPDLASGYRYIAREPVLSYNVYGNTLLNFGVGIFNPMLVVYCYEQLHSDNYGYTALEVAQLVGLFLAGTFTALFTRTRAAGRVMVSANLALGLLVAALAVVSSIYVAAVLVFAAGAANVVSNSLSRTMLMERASVEHRTKVINARMTLGRPVNTLGALFAGLLIDRANFTVSAIIAVGGAFIVVYALLALAPGRVVVLGYERETAPAGASRA